MLIIYLILLLFDYISSGNVEFYFDFNNLIYLVIFLGAASLLFYAEKLEKSDKIEFEKVNMYISHAFLGMLLIVAVQSIAPPEALKWVRTSLMVAAVAFGLITFYLNRDKLSEIEDEAEHEDAEEKRRKIEFVGRYPRIDKVWWMRWAAKWIYKEGWWYCLIILILLIIGLFLRVYNVENITPGRDEFHQIIAAKSLYENGQFDYERGIFLTYPVAFLFNLFGESLLIARLPVIIFGILSGFLIYLLGKKISKNVGLIGMFLWMVLPWSIAMSQFLREYMVGIFLGLLFFLILIDYFRNNEIKFNPKTLKFLVGIYAGFFLIVKLSTAATFGITFMTLFFPLIVLFFFKKYGKQSYIFIPLTFIGGGLALIPFLKLLGRYGPIGTSYFEPFNLNWQWFNVFLNSYNEFPMMWYSFQNFTSLFLIFFVCISLFLYYKNETYLTYFCTFIFTLMFFMFFLPEKEYFVERYIFYVIPFFIILFSSSIYTLIVFSNKKYKLNLLIKNFILIVLVLVLVFPPNIFQGMKNELSISTGDVRQVFSVENRDLSKLYSKLDTLNITNDTIIITSIPSELIWKYSFNISEAKLKCVDLTCYSLSNNMYFFTEKNETIKKYSSGIVIVEIWRDIPKLDFELENKKIKYLGKFSYRYGIWKWG